jgi:hypothetical protein
MGTDLPRSTAPIGAVVRRKRFVILISRAASMRGVGMGWTVQARRAVYGPGSGRVKMDRRRWAVYDG